ncbi:MAG: DUF86 domain-containing protein [Nanoarchaeota archaeon]|mgnify:CR=1 FL=1
MKDRIIDKIREIETLCEELASICPKRFGEYDSDIRSKAACERYVERIVESFVDIAFLIIRLKALSPPDDEKGSFDRLAQEGIITPDLAERLKDAKGMRNILAHQYGMIDDRIVFDAVSDEIPRDAKELIITVKDALKTELIW